MAEENQIPMGKWGPTDAWIKETNAKWLANHVVTTVARPIKNSIFCCRCLHA